MEMDYENRMVAAEYLPEDEGDNPLRPRTLTEYIGQEKVKGNLSVFIDAAKLRGEALDHVLLYGPPGLGKTTLAAIIANELGVNFRITSGPALERAGDLAALLTNLDQGDVLFIDEVHRLPRTVEEILYPAMEDFSIDIINGKGQGAASIHLPLPRFTLIGATTRAGQLSAPLRDRFGVILRLELYTPEELGRIVERSAKILDIPCDPGRRSRDRLAVPRHPPDRQPAAQTGEGFRAGDQRRQHQRDRSPAGPRPSGGRRAGPGYGGPPDAAGHD